MSDLLYSDVNDNSETARTPLNGTRSYNDPLDTDSIGDPRSIHSECDPLDIRGVARNIHRVRVAVIAPQWMSVMTLLAKLAGIKARHP